jgi:hypothetical protein
MTSHVARLYAIAASILALFLGWLGIAAQPWATSKPTPQAQPPALARLEGRLNRDAALLAQVAAARRNAPQTVRVVTLPPLTTTRTS